MMIIIILIIIILCCPLTYMKSYYFFLVELAEKEGVNLGAIAMAFEGYILSKYVSDNDFGMTFMLKLLFV